MPNSPNPSKPPLILLVGPTAVGKTEIAIQLAERLDGEIISADSRLFYRGMDIGTAKPSAAERRRVPHHLIDVVDPDQTLSLADFQEMVQHIMQDLERRGKLPLLVGGTGQYVRAVTQGWILPEVEPDTKVRDELERLKLERGPEWLYQRLTELDPEAAARIDARNARRTIRALEVIQATGRKFSEQGKRSDSPYRLITIGLKRPRPELYCPHRHTHRWHVRGGPAGRSKKPAGEGIRSGVASHVCHRLSGMRACHPGRVERRAGKS